MLEYDAAIIVNAKKAVVFDLFHTLVSLKSAWGDNLPRVHEILGVSREAWGVQLERKLHDLYAGRMKDAFSATAEMARAIDPTIPDEVIKTAVKSIIETFAGALIGFCRDDGGAYPSEGPGQEDWSGKQRVNNGSGGLG